MVAHEGMTLAEVDVLEVGVDSEACLGKQLLKKIVAESLLKIEVCLALVHIHANSLLRHTGIKIGKHMKELLVLEHPIRRQLG